MLRTMGYSLRILGKEHYRNSRECKSRRALEKTHKTTRDLDHETDAESGNKTFALSYGAELLEIAESFRTE